MRVRRPVAASLVVSAALALTGCAEEIPGAGTNRSLTVAVATVFPAPPAPAGGHIDAETLKGTDLTVVGWAPMSDYDASSLTVVSSTPVSVVSAYRTIRPDVTVALNDRRLVWSGFSVTVRATSGRTPTAVCLTSTDPVFGDSTIVGADIPGCVK